MDEINEKVIMGILIGKREQEAIEVQKLLTEYGCYLKTRLGLHETTENLCSSKGFIIIEFIANCDLKIKELEEKLNKIDDVKVRLMIF